MVNVTPEDSTKNSNLYQQQPQQQNENSEPNHCWEERHVHYVDIVHRYNYLEYIASTTCQDLQSQIFVNQHHLRQASGIINQLMVENSVLRIKANQAEQEIADLRATAIDIIKNNFAESSVADQPVKKTECENNITDTSGGTECLLEINGDSVSTTVDMPSSSSDSNNISPGITEASSVTITTTTASSVDDNSSDETANLYPPSWSVLLQKLLQPPQFLNMSSRLPNFPVSEEAMSLAALSYLGIGNFNLQKQ